MLGRPLKIDEPMIDWLRPSVTRISIEIDLLMKRENEIFIRYGEHVFTQKVIYEKCPQYCTKCLHLGHDLDACFGEEYQHKLSLQNKNRKEATTKNKPTSEKGKQTVDEHANHTKVTEEIVGTSKQVWVEKNSNLRSETEQAFEQCGLMDPPSFNDMTNLENHEATQNH